MTTIHPSAARLTIAGRPVSNFVATAAAIAVLITLYVFIDWADTPDWRGYLYLYAAHGGWLAKRGTDPLFVALLSASQSIFGIGNYAGWRASVFIAFLFVTAYIGLEIDSRRNNLSAFLLSFFVLVTIFLLKGLIQIREGIAFCIVLFGIVPLFKGTSGRYKPLLFFTIASLIHSGLIAIAACYAASLFIDPNRGALILQQRVQIAILLSTGVLGFIAASYIHSHAGEIISRSIVLGSDTSKRFRSSTIKSIYWAGLGLVMLGVRHYTVSALKGNNHGYIFCIFIATGLLPFCYFLALFLNVLGFQAPIIISMFVRALATALDLCLVIIASRGHARPIAIMFCVIILSDRIRTMLLFLDII